MTVPSAGAMIDADEAISVLNALGVAARHADRLSGGLISDTFAVDGRWVVRFPRSDAAAVRREIDVLTALAGELELATPELDVVGHHRDMPVVMHRMLPGGRAPSSFYRSDQGQSEVARIIGSIHGARPDLPMTTTEEWRRRFDRFLSQIDEVSIPDGLRRRVDDAAARFREDLSSMAFTVFIHNDLGADHLLVEEGRVVGVIDWSEAGWGDPARDLVGVMIEGGRTATAAVAASLGLDEAVGRRAEHYFWFDSAHLAANVKRFGRSDLLDSAVEELADRLDAVGF